MVDIETFGKKLKAAWKASGKTQERVVEGTTLNVRTFQRLMGGAGNPGLDTILALSKSLNIEPADLLTDASSMRGDQLPHLSEPLWADLSHLVRGYLISPLNRQQIALYFLTGEKKYLDQFVGRPEYLRLVKDLKKDL